MEIGIFCPAWGMMETDLEVKLQRIKNAGFDGVEMGAPKEKAACRKARQLLDQYELLFIAQVWTAGKNAEEHMQSLEEQAECNSELSPLFINAQSGKDHFSFKDNLKLLKHADSVSRKYQVQINHETHRGRFAFAAHVTCDYLKEMPSLTLTADFSHWCCVSESFLDDQQKYVEAAIGRTMHIHARIGYAEGPQITDPRAGEWGDALNAHLKWWDGIVEKNRKNDLGLQTITPEFGPPGYLHTLPFTNLPVADQWDINCYMKDLLKERYKKDAAPRQKA